MPADRAAVAVAYSGGMDSTALLHATATAAAPLDIAVLALHVHHGLSAHADDWLAHCDAFCRRLQRRGHDVAFIAHRLTSRPGAGESVEAWARQARYRALRQMAEAGGADLVLLAHHRRDQAETFLLQALRKGGVAALSAMPAAARREGITWARPWLAEPREAIEAYVRRHRLAAILDDSNDDVRFARNRLRADVWPALIDCFPDAEASLATAARWAQQASAAIDEIAGHDVHALKGTHGLVVPAWRALSPARQAPALRRWIHEQIGRPAPASLVARLLAEVETGETGRWPAPGGELYHYRGELRWQPAARRRTGCAVRVDAREPGLYPVEGWHGALRVDRVKEGGVSLTVAADLTLRARAPGDRFQAGPARPPRSLKLQFQAVGVSANERRGPVVCHGDVPVFVPGLGIDARALARPGEPQRDLCWLPVAGPADPTG